ncbi:hypothetical protein C2845_PM11G13510 [Panicum miliaceum]|uniref:Uncharacterized protein n=1 Tax=Panicum miliaceum TaxID=4540 RepID=A0A3L6RNI8_PANMI|nr:hypothetical protein C2845_PM11G13510 [Panicum miliaceum]
MLVAPALAAGARHGRGELAARREADGKGAETTSSDVCTPFSPRCPDGEANGTTAARCHKWVAFPTPEPTAPLLVIPASELAGGCSTPGGISVTSISIAGYSGFNRRMVVLASCLYAKLDSSDGAYLRSEWHQYWNSREQDIAPK